MRAQDLHIMVPYSNPVMWQNREKVHTQFEDAILDSGARVSTIECATGDRPFFLKERTGVTRHQVRSSGRQMGWNKENLQNILVRRTDPAISQYLGFIDGDILFRRKDWASLAVEALQHYHVIQPWEHAYDLGPNGEHLQAEYSFCSRYYQGYEPTGAIGITLWGKEQGPYVFPHCGYAWCMTRQAFDWLGGLIETAVAGAADHHMAMCLIGQAYRSIHGQATKGYGDPIYAWQDRATAMIKGHIGYIPGTIEHLWHGRKKDRRYVDRWKILVENKFDPITDLKHNSYGVLELTGNKPNLTKDMDHYYRQRNEDHNSVS